MSSYAVDPTQVSWKGRGGFGRELDYRASWRNGVLVFKPKIRSLRDLVVWASGKSNDWITKVENAIWNHSAITFPSTLYFALWTTTLDATKTGSSSGEAAYTSYARVAVTANSTNFSTSSGGSGISNSVAITWAANSGVSSETETYVAVLDASSAGNILYWGSITSTTINVGDTPQINTSAMSASEA